MPTQNEILSTIRLKAMMKALQDEREISQDYAFSRRLPDVPAEDSEIMARFIGRVLIADLVADDQRAATYSMGKLTFESTSVPNLKLGIKLTQEQLNQIRQLTQNGDMVSGAMYPFSERGIIETLLDSIRARKEALAVARAINGMSYDRLGIKMENVSFGMPSDLDVTPTYPWTDHTNGTPVTDILTMVRYARVRYGIVYTRLTMSIATFNHMTACAEFINRARFVLFPSQPAAAIPLQATGYMLNLAKSVLGVDEIELYDTRYWIQTEAGALESAPFLPLSKVVFSARQNDNNAMAADFANGVVTESIVADATNAGINGTFGGPTRGPVAYSTGGHNPPNITYWGVARGFPRKHMLQETAVLNVGEIEDDIPVGEPF